MTDDLDPGRFYRPRDVAERWGVGRKTVYVKIQTGELRARKIGNGWAVHGSAIRDYEAGTDFGCPSVPALE
jgi:excisionase family DNA binding protein